MRKMKVTWNPGQQPASHSGPRLPAYSAQPEIIDVDLRAAWNNLLVGEMLIALQPHFVRSNFQGGWFPHPILFPGDLGRGHDITVPVGQLMVYLGMTNVDCRGTKGKIISKPYPTVLFNGVRYLVQDPNHLKPLAA